MKAFWHTGTVSPSTSAVRYSWIAGGRDTTWGSQESWGGAGGNNGRSVPLTEDVTITKITVWLTTAPGASKSWDFTFRDDQVSTAATVNISGTNTTGQWTGSVNVLAGSLVSMMSTPTGTPAATGNMSYVIEYTTGGNYFLMVAGVETSASGNGVFYMQASGCSGRGPTGTATTFHEVCPIGMTVTKAAFSSQFTTNAGSNSYVMCLRKNNTTDSDTITLTGTGQPVVASITSFAVAAGDTINTKVDPSASAAWTTYATCYTCTPDTVGDIPMMYASARTVSNAVSYEGPQAFGSDANWGATEANVQYRMPAGTMKRLYVALGTAPGGVAARTITSRVNGTDQTLASTCTGAATTSNNTSDTISLAEGDLVSVKNTPANSPADSVITFALVVNMLQTVAGTMDTIVMKAHTASLTGSETVTGAVNSTMKAATAALTGAETVSGALDAAMKAATAVLTGAETINGTIVATMAKAVAALSGSVTVAGTLDATMKKAVFAAAGTETLASTMAKMLFTATGSESVQASLVVSMKPATADITAFVGALPTLPTVPSIKFAIARGLPVQNIVSPTQLVVLRTHRGVQLGQWLPNQQLSLLWTRNKRTTSRCELSVVSDMGLTQRIPNIVPFLHWIDVFDDQGNDLLWTGPIVEFEGGREEIKITARDVSVYAEATRNPLTKRWEAADPAVVAGEFYAKMIQHHNLTTRTIVRPDPLGQRYDFQSKADAAQMDKVIDDLVNMGLSWSVVNGTPILGPLSRKPVVSLGEEHFVGAGITIKRDGRQSYNDILLRSATNLARVKVPMGGLALQKIVEIDDMFGVSNTDKATKEYARYASRIRNMVTIPGGSVLRHDAPVSIAQLLPTARLTLEAYNELFLMELTDVEVQSQSGSSTVAVTLESVDDQLPELVKLQNKQSISGVGQ